MSGPAYRPHDLVFLASADGFETMGARPEWLESAWLAQAPLVVRREVTAPGRLPVGARGLLRNQRCAGYAQVAALVRRVTPEELVATLGGEEAAHDLPCIIALRRLKPHLDALGLAWGPVGGAGFWLATGLPVLRPGSDLDLLVYASAPLPAADVAVLTALRAKVSCRVDIQIDTGVGGFALLEYARGDRVLLKTARGPLLLHDPWQAPEAA